MSKIIFITGTDTSVGKTRVSASLLAGLRHRGIDARYFKPVQTGSNIDHGDPQYVESVSKLNQGATFPCLYSLKLPASPHLAASVQGLTLSVNEMVKKIRHYALRSEVLIVEGAGGLLVPINRRATILDLIQQIDCAPVLVSRNALGTLNHTALSLRLMKDEGCIPAAVILNAIVAATSKADQIIRKDNALMIKKMIRNIPLVRMEFTYKPTGNTILTSGLEIVSALRLT